MPHDSRVDDGLRARLDAELPGRVRYGRAEVAAFAGDASRAVPIGLPAAVVEAASTSDVSAVLKIASEYGRPVSVRGAGTGLAGGAVAYPDGLVISLARMAAVLEVDVADRLIRVQAGVVTSKVDEIAAEHGLMYAPDPASFRESTIGGNIATNAGGLRCLRYGVTSDHVAGLQVVLADGAVVETGARTRKNAVGYDLTALFVGSEGTLGIVTEATLRLVPRPTHTAAVRALFDSITDAGRAVARIMAELEVPEMLELLDEATVAAVTAAHPGLLQGNARGVLLLGGFVGVGADANAESAAAIARESGAVEALAAPDDALLEARRFSSKSLSAQGLRVSSDVAVPVSRLVTMFEQIGQIAREEGVSIPTFAHAGDGNLHPSVVVHPGDDTAREHAEIVLDRISEVALQLGGTLSGEHGVGSLKREKLGMQLDVNTWDAHHRIKAALDPVGILSPGRAI